MMRHDRIDAPPFGDDEDANRAVKSSARGVERFVQEAQKLAAMRTRDLALRAAQKDLVASLRGEIESRARAFHVDPDRFLEACRRELERRTRRRIVIPEVAGPAPLDPKVRELEGALLEAEIVEANRRRLLTGAQARFDQAAAAARAARDRLTTYRTVKGIHP